MRSDKGRTSCSKPSAHDLHQTPGIGTTQSCSCTALAVGDHILFTKPRRRAWSEPPRISTQSSRNEPNGEGEELEDKRESTTFEQFPGKEGPSFCLHFYHADFEVIARNISEKKAQELKHTLTAFAASLKPVKTFASHRQDLCTQDSNNLVSTNKVNHASASLDHSGTTVKFLRGDDYASPDSRLRQARHLSYVDTAGLRTYACYKEKAFKEVQPQLAAGTDLGVTSASLYCNTVCHCRSSRRDINESESGSSIDFLHFAREKDTDAVRLLEEEYDNMMSQVE